MLPWEREIWLRLKDGYAKKSTLDRKNRLQGSKREWRIEKGIEHLSSSQNAPENPQNGRAIKFPNCSIFTLYYLCWPSSCLLNASRDKKLTTLQGSTFYLQTVLFDWKFFLTLNYNLLLGPNNTFYLLASPLAKEVTDYFWSSFLLLRKLILRNVKLLARITQWTSKRPGL